MPYPQQQVPAHLTIDPAERPFLVAWHHTLDLSVYREGQVEYMRYNGHRHDSHRTASLVIQLIVSTVGKGLSNERSASVIEDWIKANTAAAPKQVYGPANPEHADSRLLRPGYELHSYQKEAVESIMNSGPIVILI